MDNALQEASELIKKELIDSIVQAKREHGHHDDTEGLIHTDSWLVRSVVGRYNPKLVIDKRFSLLSQRLPATGLPEAEGKDQ